MNYTIEELRDENANEYARVNMLAWKQSYKGIVDDDFLELLNTKEEIERQTERLKQGLNDQTQKAFLLRVDGEVKGVLRVRKSKFNEYPDYGELGAIYLLDDIKGKGFGKILFEKAKEELINMGYNKMINSCFEGNPSNEFYKHMGGKPVGKEEIKIPNGQVLIENIYIYDNI